jgi:hypothetical protein
MNYWLEKINKQKLIDEYNFVCERLSDFDRYGIMAVDFYKLKSRYKQLKNRLNAKETLIDYVCEFGWEYNISDDIVDNVIKSVKYAHTNDWDKLIDIIDHKFNEEMQCQ